MFKHPREAQAILQEQVTYHIMKGGIRMGIKLGIVVTFYVTACQSAHTIRNYINPLDHAASGFILGAAYRIIGGPKAMLGNKKYIITHPYKYPPTQNSLKLCQYLSKYKQLFKELEY